MFSYSRPLCSPDGGGGAPKADFTLDAYAALLKVLDDPPSDVSASLAIAVCATNFYNTATVAVQGGAIPPEAILRCLELKNPTTGERVFHETKILSRLVEVVSGVIRDRIRDGKAIEYSALQHLREYAAMPHLIGVESSIAAYRALLAAVTRFYRVSDGEGTDSPTATDPVAEISSLASLLQAAAIKHPTEISEFVREMGKVPVLAPLEEGVNDVLTQLSGCGVENGMSKVHGAALTALVSRLSLSQGRPANSGTQEAVNRCSMFHLLIETLSRSEDPHLLTIAAPLVLNVLRNEVKEIQLSLDNLKQSSFALNDFSLDYQCAVERLIPRMKKICGEGYAGSEAVHSLKQAAAYGRILGWGVLAFDCTYICSKVLPAGIADRINQGIYWAFRRAV